MSSSSSSNENNINLNTVGIPIISTLQQQSTTSLSSSSSSGNLVIHTIGTIKNNDDISLFYKETISNCKKSILQSHMIRYDLLRNLNNPKEFLLIQIYNDSYNNNSNNNNDNNNDWNDKVNSLLENSNELNTYTTIYPKKVKCNS